ncbi:MAG: NrfD/PsrC family molybdoenzyme membrane anchor subunit [Gemmatimonadaceae bacterium]|nr:NrfD/PsrC family molybdoenzyme membrane anchor subunit [Gemmatimonadaceae bacterium]
MNAMPLSDFQIETVPSLARPARRTVTDVERDLLATLDPLGGRGRLWIASLLAVCGIAFIAWIQQLRYGLTVTSMRNYVSWGVYMTNFVFFIGISHAGTLISAILRVTDAGWRRPITRMAEAITVIALLIGASSVVIDMGRPDRLLNLLIHGRLQSPILWDLVSVTTYLTGSFLYLYVAMIPDMPMLAEHARERGRSPKLVRLYELLSLGFRETPAHRRLLARALGAMAVIIIPVAVSVHTVVSWVFGMTLRPGWHSTIFGPYFVVGAIFSGTAGIITAMMIFRRAYHLERYLLPEHFHKLAKILLVLSLLYAYFTLSEYLTAWYGGLESDARLLDLLAGGTAFGRSFWLWAAFGLFVPIGLLLFPSRRSLGAIMTASVLINIGMWWKRFLIVVPTLETPFIPAQAAGIAPRYFPSLVECLITAGAFAGFLLLFTLFSRLFPILSIWETVEDAEEVKQATVRTGHALAGAGHAHARMSPATLGIALLLAAGAAAAAPWSAAHAQTAQGKAVIELTRTTEGEEEMLVAKVTANGLPVKGATVAFSVRRTFGLMTLGEDQTLDDGTAAVAFPTALPGDAKGELTFRVALRSPPELDSSAADVKLAGAPARPWPSVPPRALWSSRVPLAIPATFAFLVLCVWSTYAFVVRQLAALRKLKQES